MHSKTKLKIKAWVASFSMLVNFFAPLAAHAAPKSSVPKSVLLDTIAKKPIGSVISVEDRVVVDGRKVRGAEPIYLGSVIETGSGRARVAIGNDTVVDLDNGSRFRVVNLEDSKHAGSMKIAGMLDYGRLKGVSRDDVPEKVRNSEVVTTGGHFKVDGGRFFVDAPNPNAGDGGKIKFMSVDRASTVDVVKPVEVVNNLVWKSTVQASNRKVSDLSAVDVDGGDSVTSGARRKMRGAPKLLGQSEVDEALRQSALIGGGRGSDEEDPSTPDSPQPKPIVINSKKPDEKGPEDKAPDNQEEKNPTEDKKPDDKTPEGDKKPENKKLDDEKKPDDEKKDNDKEKTKDNDLKSKDKTKDKEHDDNGHGNDPGKVDPSNPGGGGSGEKEKSKDGEKTKDNDLKSKDDEKTKDNDNEKTRDNDLKSNDKTKDKEHDDNGHGNDPGKVDPSNPGGGGGGGGKGGSGGDGKSGSGEKTKDNDLKSKTKEHDDNGHGNDPGKVDPSNPGGGDSGEKEKSKDNEKTKDNDLKSKDDEKTKDNDKEKTKDNDLKSKDKTKDKEHDDNGHGNDPGKYDPSNPGGGGGGGGKGGSGGDGKSGSSGGDGKGGDGGGNKTKDNDLKSKTKEHDDNGHGNDPGKVDPSNPGGGGGGGGGGGKGGSGGGEKTSKVSLKPGEVLEVDPVQPKSGANNTAEKTQLSPKQMDSMLNSFSVKSNADKGMGLASGGKSGSEEGDDKKKAPTAPKGPTTTSIPGLDPLQKKSTQPGRLNVRFNR